MPIGATAGVAELEISAGRLTGTVTAEPTEWGATVTAGLEVSCFVAGAPNPANGASGSGTSFFESADLEAPECAALRAYR